VNINSYTGVNETLLLLILISYCAATSKSNVAESSKRSDVALLHIFFHSEKKNLQHFGEGG